MKTAEHENTFFRDTVGYSIGALGIHRLACSWRWRRVLERGLHRHQRPVLDRGWPEWWGWWLEPADLAPTGSDPWEYQNIFTTRVQVRPAGLRRPRGRRRPRRASPSQLHLLGRIGDAQIGPIYLGGPGSPRSSAASSPSRSSGSTCWPSVELGPDPVRPPAALAGARAAAPEYGLVDPAAQRGRLVADGGLLPDHVDPAVVGRMYRRARALGMGTHVAWAFAAAIWLYLVLGFIRPLLMGSWARRCRSASSRT